MSPSSKLTELVFGDERPDLILTKNGKIASSWCEAYKEFIDQALNASNNATWSRELVQAAHWVSFYLPLRCKAAAKLAKVSTQTSTLVFDLHIWTEKRLWRDLDVTLDENTRSRLAATSPLLLPENEIIRLCLGSANPAAVIADNSELLRWRTVFKNNWDIVDCSLRETNEWEKWVIMAARVGSFYWDLLFRQEVVIPNPADMEFPVLQLSLPTTTQAIISLILNPPSNAIESSGLPIIFDERPLSQFSLRSIVETSLLRRIPESNPH